MTKKRYLKKSLILFFVLALAVIIYQVALSMSSGVAKASSLTSEFTGTLVFYRWGFIVLMAVFWDKVVVLFSMYRSLTEAQTTYAKSLRWRVTAYLVIAEILIVGSLPSTIINYLG